MSGLDLTTRIVTRLIPRDAITYAPDRSTRGKIDCFDIRSQTQDRTYSAQYAHASDSFWCACQGFMHLGYCHHSDSLRFYMAQRAFARVIRTETDAYLVARDIALTRQSAAHGLDWEELAEWAAIGKEAGRRLAQDEQGVAA
jgi:hypothetical protein